MYHVEPFTRELTRHMLANTGRTSLSGVAPRPCYLSLPAPSAKHMPDSQLPETNNSLDKQQIKCGISWGLAWGHFQATAKDNFANNFLPRDSIS
jgi:hypothetical protein